ncbi:lantibiotic dehydratase [Streptomyces cavourensis]|uniref:Lantibiotic dehydratase family protein n=1 Tax=Streptomyces cavourensis TaxID=67258 RepID=A0ABY5F7N3_9ACTN|nr:lantibiotic dehydratase [Streptomyces cavourensis]UTR79679.1 lantibiotic dehydratase family protein [Streptomyces cavourensis]
MSDDGALLLGRRWRLWEQFSLRGPGFPVGGVLDLAPVDVSVYADKFAGGVLSGPDWDEFEGVFGEVAARTAVRLQGVAGSSDFTAAVAWQNRTVLRTGLRPFLGWVPSASGRSSMPRQREELVAHYWQRFCVKNDTIGFFGPVGWGRVDGSVGGVEVDPGEGLTASSSVFFSSWSIDALAKRLSADERLMAWIPPRRLPYIRAESDEGPVHVPGRRPQQAPPHLVALLRLADGRRSPHELARILGTSLDEVTSRLTELVGRRWVSWRLEVPSGACPDRELRAVLERVGDAELRRGALEPLEVLERGRERVEAAGRDAEALCEALAALEEDFTRITDTASQRAKGSRTAPNRSLVYSDTRRSATARIGGTVLEAMAPLDPLMTSAAWLMAQLGARVERRAVEVYEKLSAASGEERVNLADFWFASMPILHGGAVTDAQEVLAEFQRRWARIIPLPEGEARVRTSHSAVASQVAEAFPPAPVAWTAARYLSPDVLIAARDTESIGKGDFELVLGELHLASNTMGASLFVSQHPEPAELLRLTGRDHPGPRLLPLLPKEHKARLSTRVRNVLVRPEDYYVALMELTADPHRDRTVLSADAHVVRRDGRPVVVLPDGAEFPVTDVFGHVLTTLAMDMFRLFPDADHVPRVMVDKLVVSRESWRFTGGELGFAEEKSEARRYVRARNWRGERGLPRYVFVVSPTEPRPFYVDFDAPVYVNILAKAARRLARKDPEAKLTVTEMLPSPEHAWLTDDRGNTYTSELRFVAVDQHD